MRKTYDIPENASFEHLTSFLTAKGFDFLVSNVKSIGVFRYIGR